jgi:hypothetical protein
MIRKDGFCLSKSWKLLICFLKKPPELDARATMLQGFEGLYMLAILAP